MYFSGQGKVYVATRDSAGNPVNLGWVGNVSAFEVSLETSTTEHKESYSGQRLTDLRLETGKTASLSATFEEWDAPNLARVLRGVYQAGVTTAQTDEVVVTFGASAISAIATTPLRFATKKKNIGTTVTMKDSTGTPKTLVKDTHFRVLSASAGIIEIYSLTGLTPVVEPFKITYTPSAHTEVGMLTQGPTDYYLMFDGINTANNNSPVIAEFFKVQFSPAQSIPLINEELGSFEVAGSVLLDGLRSSDTTANPMGQFGKITYI
jgi:hypothetical protein